MFPDYTDLGRIFTPLQDSEDQEEATRLSYLHFGGKTLSWDDLLASRVVVVLAEAGSGKSWEFRAFASRADSRERPVFLLQLQVLADGSFQDATAPADSTRLRQWQRGENEAVFLLDSVDESRITTTEGFRVALRRFRRAIGPAVSRARVVLSSRVSEWRHGSDTRLVCDELGLGERPASGVGKAEPPAFRAVLLAPLSNEQVGRLAQARLGDRAGAFADALTAAHAWDFARRPLDARELIEFWGRTGRLGSLPEIIEASVERKLRPRVDRAEPAALAPDRARQGAERLAAASLLCRQLTFCVPEDSPPESWTGTPIPAHRVLADWTQEEVRTLLGRPLFDPAAFGRIRFHHRLTAEYLAAQWVLRRVASGCPASRVEMLLLPVVRGRQVIVRSLAGVTAWICQATGDERWRTRLRNTVLQVAPGALLDHGDPRLLPLDIKRAVLRSGLRSEAGLSLDAHDLERFAEPGLAADLHAMLDVGQTDDAQLMLGLRILWHGRVVEAHEAAADALRLALTPTLASEIRVRAVRAADAAGSPQQRRRLAARLPGASPTIALATDAVNTLHPDAMDTAGLLALIATFPEVPMFGGTGLPQAIADAVPDVPDRDLADFVRQLAGLAAPHLPADTRPPGSIPFGWLAEPLVPALERLLARPTLDTAENRAAADGLEVAGPLMLNWQRGSSRNTTLQAASQAHPGLREEVLARLFRPPRNASDFPWHSAVRWCREDLAVLSRWIASEPDAASKNRLLGLASTGWHWTGRHAGDRRLLLKAASRNPGVPNAARLLPGRLRLSIAILRSRAHQERVWRLRQRLVRWQAQVRRWRQWWMHVRHLQALRDGRWSDALAALAHGWLDERRTGRGVRPGYPDFPDPFQLVRSAARKGWQRRWRDAEIRLPAESGGMIEHDLLIGLAGFEVSLDEGLVLRNLTAGEANIAGRMAARTLYGLPPWFAEFEEAQPKATSHVIEECMAGDWALREPTIRMLHIGGWLGQLALPTRQAIQPFAASLLAGPEAHPEVLGTALDLCFCTTSGRAAIVGLAPARLHALSERTAEYEMWLWAWLHVDPRALAHLEGLSQDKPDVAGDLVVRLTRRLFGRRVIEAGGGFSSAFDNVQSLSRLIALLHQHVRPEQDIRHGPGIHPVTDRDEVQRIRDTLLYKLAQRTERGVFATLQALRSHPAMRGRTAWVDRLIAAWVEQEAEPEPWQPAHLLEFEALYETTPRTDRALFGMGVMRLDDIRRMVEHDDASVRNELTGSEPEEDLQRWTLRKLRMLSRDRYSAEREVETDRNKNPDIRLSVPGVSPVSLELKWAQDWSYPELQHALERQLVGQYLCGPGLRYGVLVLANGRTSRNAARKYWQLPEGGRLSFEQLVIELRRVASDILNNSQDVDGLEVVGIDFT